MRAYGTTCLFQLLKSVLRPKAGSPEPVLGPSQQLKPHEESKLLSFESLPLRTQPNLPKFLSDIENIITEALTIKNKEIIINEETRLRISQPPTIKLGCGVRKAVMPL